MATMTGWGAWRAQAVSEDAVRRVLAAAPHGEAAVWRAWARFDWAGAACVGCYAERATARDAMRTARADQRAVVRAALSGVGLCATAREAVRWQRANWSPAERVARRVAP